jgi:hypothetical protein
MKLLFSLATLLLVGMKCLATVPTMPGASFNPGSAEVIWAAATNGLPDSIWIYRSVKQEFSPTLVSNLMWLGALTKKNTAKSPDADEIRDKDAVYYTNKEGTRRLAIYPSVGWIDYKDETAQASMREAAKKVPSEEEAYRLALKYLRFAGVDSSQLALKPGTTDFRIHRMEQKRGYFDRELGKRVEDVGLRGVYFTRWIDRMEFTGLGTVGGFLVEFGDEGKVFQLMVNWRNFQPHRLLAFPTSEQFVERIQKGLAVAIDPIPASIKKVTIKKVAPFYKGLAEDEKQPFLYPFVDMELDLDVGTTNRFLRVTCPIVVDE